MKSSCYSAHCPNSYNYLFLLFLLQKSEPAPARTPFYPRNRDPTDFSRFMRTKLLVQRHVTVNSCFSHALNLSGTKIALIIVEGLAAHI